jgi:hypothetical protein
LWSKERFSDYNTYGKIVFDTHIYTPNFDDLNKMMAKYDEELGKVKAFQD